MSTADSTEVWRPVVGYEGLYEVSNLGRIRSLEATVRGPHGSKQRKPAALLIIYMGGNYPTVKLHRNDKGKTIRVHRIVLEAFVGPCPKGMECRHFPDGNHTNNRLDNLSWGTKKENAADRELQGQTQRGESNRMAKLTVEVVRKIRELYATGEYSQKRLGDMFGVRQTAIFKIVNRKHWTHV